MGPLAAREQVGANRQHAEANEGVAELVADAHDRHGPLLQFEVHPLHLVPRALADPRCRTLVAEPSPGLRDRVRGLHRGGLGRPSGTTGRLASGTARGVVDAGPAAIGLIVLVVPAGPDASGYNPRDMAETEPPDIVIVERRIEPAVLSTLVRRHFEDMVKYVVDVERGLAAVGGELHADEEELLLDRGSRQEDLWGMNYYPGRGRDGCIEFTSLINIRPAQGNPGMTVEDPGVRRRIRELTYALIGEGEPLP
jgi:Protein of unknown function (DUF5674)